MVWREPAAEGVDVALVAGGLDLAGDRRAVDADGQRACRPCRLLRPSLDHDTGSRPTARPSRGVAPTSAAVGTVENASRPTAPSRSGVTGLAFSRATCSSFSACLRVTSLQSMRPSFACATISPAFAPVQPSSCATSSRTGRLPLAYSSSWNCGGVVPVRRRFAGVAGRPDWPDGWPPRAQNRALGSLGQSGAEADLDAGADRMLDRLRAHHGRWCRRARGGAGCGGCG